MKQFLFIIGLCMYFLAHTACRNPQQGEVHTLEAVHSQYLPERQVDIWTPNGFPEDGVTYSTLYMHDGQMLFDSALTWNHQEWNVDGCLQSLIDKKLIKPCIAVAVYSTKDRFGEYAPQAPMDLLPDSVKSLLLEERLQFGSVNSDAYLNYLVKELKPTIEKNYPVSKNREDVFIAGSSMGGMISWYALLEYPEVFGGAACLSSHWPLTMKTADPSFTLASLAYMKEQMPLEPHSKLYFDHGDQDLDNFYPALQARVDSFFYNNDTWGLEYRSKAFPGHGHQERYWQERLHLPLTFLLSNNNQ